MRVRTCHYAIALLVFQGYKVTDEKEDCAQPRLRCRTKANSGFGVNSPHTLEILLCVVFHCSLLSLFCLWMCVHVRACCIDSISTWPLEDLGQVLQWPQLSVSVPTLFSVACWWRQTHSIMCQQWAWGQVVMSECSCCSLKSTKSHNKNVQWLRSLGELQFAGLWQVLLDTGDRALRMSCMTSPHYPALTGRLTQGHFR